MPLVEDNHVVETLSSQGPDHPLDERTLPRRARRCQDLLDAESLNPLGEGRAVDAVSVPQQVPRRRIPGKGLDDLGRTSARAEVTASGAGRLCDEQNFWRSAALGCIKMPSGAGKTEIPGRVSGACFGTRISTCGPMRPTAAGGTPTSPSADTGGLRAQKAPVIDAYVNAEALIVGEGAGGRKTALRSGRPGSLLTLAPHRSGRAGSAASGSSTDSFATRRRVPAGPGSQAMATAIPTACLASSAIRCRDVETGPNLGVLAVFPSNGATCRCPLPSTGSRGLNSPASAVL